MAEKAEKKNFVDINGNPIEDVLCAEDDSHGLMCPEDKVKLDGIEEGANKVEALTDEEINAICDFDGVAESNAIPVATKAALGCVVAGDGLDINEDGVLSVTSQIQDSVPIGSIVEWNGDIIPENWLLLNGQAVSRTGYAELFALYGTKYGEGDGSTTFNLPDYRRRVPVGMDETDTDFDELGNTGGEKTHQLTEDEMPKHQHKFQHQEWFASDTALSENTGAIYSWKTSTGGSTSKAYSSADGNYGYTGNDQPHNNLQPYIVTNFIVKAKLYQTRLLPESGMIIDSLTSDSSTDALSALQGKALNEQHQVLSERVDAVEYRGGELLAYGIGYNTASQSSTIAKDGKFNFSSSYIPSKEFSITNYEDDILYIYDEGTYPSLGVNLKGIVGMIEVTVTYSGLGGSGCIGLWFQGNGETLPTGVNLPSNYVKSLLGGINGSYGGASHTYYMSVDDTASEDTTFKIDPQATAYGGTFTPAAGGTKCSLSVKVYAKRRVK